MYTLTSYSHNDLSGVHDTLGIKQLFDLFHPLETGRALRVVQGVYLVPSYAVLCGNGTLVAS
jgi:hypothetical protein